MHKCDNTLCINPKHLVLGTRAQNSLDMKTKKRSTIGERNPAAKLTSTQVEEIRLLAWAGEMQHKDIAKIYGVSRATISMISRGLRWGHVGQPSTAP